MCYSAAWGGVGAVERGFGQYAAIIQEHAGNRASREGVLYSEILGKNIEGPDSKGTMLTPGKTRVLYLAGFSHAVAQQRVRLHCRFTFATGVHEDHRMKGAPPQTWHATKACRRAFMQRTRQCAVRPHRMRLFVLRRQALGLGEPPTGEQ